LPKFGENLVDNVVARVDKHFLNQTQMDWDKNTEHILNDFIFLDRRLGDHAKIRAGVFWSDMRELILCERSPYQYWDRRGIFRLGFGEGLAGLAYVRKSYISISDIKEELPPNLGARFLTISDQYQIRSILCVPLLFG
jgi:hypothetical protein